MACVFSGSFLDGKSNNSKSLGDYCTKKKKYIRDNSIFTVKMKQKSPSLSPCGYNDLIFSFFPPSLHIISYIPLPKRINHFFFEKFFFKSPISVKGKKYLRNWWRERKRKGKREGDLYSLALIVVVPRYLFSKATKCSINPFMKK